MVDIIEKFKNMDEHDIVTIDRRWRFRDTGTRESPKNWDQSGV